MKNAKEKFDEEIKKATPYSIAIINRLHKEKKTQEVPHYMAEIIRYKKGIINEQSGFYAFSNGFYQNITDDEVRNIASELMRFANCTPTSHVLNEALKLINAYTFIKEDNFNPSNYHCVYNGLLKIDSETGEVALEQFKPNLFFNYKSEIKYNPEVDLSLIEDFLDKVIPCKNQQKVILEALAIALFPIIRRKVEFAKLTILHGSGRNGKTIFVGFCTRVIGDSACSSTSLDEILSKNKPYVLSTMYKKRANFSTETEGSCIKDSGILKQITSGKKGDEVPVEFKYRNSFKGLVNPLLVSAINRFPTLPVNKTEALVRRLQIIEFTNSFKDNPKDGELKADKRLEDPEFSTPYCEGLLILILNAAKELIQRGVLWQEGINEALKKSILGGSHLERFIDECIELDPDCKIASAELYKQYLNFCFDEGIAQEIDGKDKPFWMDERYDKAKKTPLALTKWILERFKRKIYSVQMSNIGGSQRVRGLQGLKIKEKKVENEVLNCSKNGQEDNEQDTLKDLKTLDKSDFSVDFIEHLGGDGEASL